jgi:hypothetical protein
MTNDVLITDELVEKVARAICAAAQSPNGDCYYCGPPGELRECHLGPAHHPAARAAIRLVLERAAEVAERPEDYGWKPTGRVLKSVFIAHTIRALATSATDREKV